MIARTVAICACCLVATTTSAWCCDPEDDYESFEFAEYVPADVSTYICVNDGARLRSELAHTPFGSWLTRWTISPDLVQAWSALAASAKLPGSQLFDEAFGASFTLVVRGRGASAEWAIMSRVETERSNKLLHSLKPRLVDYWQRMPIYDLPEHQLLVSRRDDVLLIGPRDRAQRKLFESVCKAMVDGLERSLEDDAAFEQAEELGDAALFVFVRHDEEPAQQGTGNHQFQLAARRIGPGAQRGVGHEQPQQVSSQWTAIAGGLSGRDLSIRHASSKPVFKVARLDDVPSWDMAPLNAISEQNVLALMNPADQDLGVIGHVIEQKLGGTNLRVAVQDRHSGRRILVLDERHDAGSTISIAQIFELGCDDACVADLNAMLADVNGNIQNLDNGAYLVQTSKVSCATMPSHKFEEPAFDEATAVFRGLPVMEPMPLQWTVAEGPTTNWIIIANDHNKLMALERALQSDADSSPMVGKWLSCGAGDGRRLAETLGKLSAPGAMSDPFLSAVNHHAIAQLSGVAGVVDHFTWRLARTDEDRLTLDVTLRLAESQTRWSSR